MDQKKKRRKVMLDVLIRGDNIIPPSLVMFSVGLIKHWGDQTACRKALAIATVSVVYLPPLPSFSLLRSCVFSFCLTR